MTGGQTGISGDKFSFHWLRITLVWTQAKSHIHFQPSEVAQTDLTVPSACTSRGTRPTTKGEHTHGVLRQITAECQIKGKTRTFSPQK